MSAVIETATSYDDGKAFFDADAFADALPRLVRAKGALPDEEGLAEVEFMIGVCYLWRAEGERPEDARMTLALAMESLSNASRLEGNQLQSAIILRMQGVAAMHLFGEAPTTEWYFAESCRILANRPRAQSDQGQRWAVEFMVSHGYQGRYELRCGRRRAALEHFRYADDQLGFCGTRPKEELDNLAWLVTVAPLNVKIGLAPRELRLAVRERNARVFWHISRQLVRRRLEPGAQPRHSRLK